MSLKTALNIDTPDTTRPGIASPVTTTLDAGEAMLEAGMTEAAVVNLLLLTLNEMNVHGMTMLRKQIEAEPEKFPATIGGVPAAEYFRGAASASDRALIGRLMAPLDFKL